MFEPTIYLDNNATTRMDPRVANAISNIFAEQLANPASQHSEGRKAHSILETAHFTISRGLDCRTKGMNADRILFTSGGTESNNLALVGLLEGRQGDLIVSSIEHPSVLGAAEAIAKQGTRRVRYLPVDSHGLASLETWSRWLADHIEAYERNDPEGRIALVSLMIGNNETGVLQPLAQIVESARSQGILVHTDAVQAVGKIPLSFTGSKVDAMSVTAHKIHGPVGIGALILRQGVPIHPLLHGGFQQLGLRPGTECVALVVGFAKAIELAVDNIDERWAHMKTLRDELESMLLANSRPPTIIAYAAPRLPHTISLAYPGIERQALQMSLDRNGIACSTGSACASGSGQPSHVLQAMQVPESVLHGAIRLSLSFETTHQEIVEAARRIESVIVRFPSTFKC